MAPPEVPLTAACPAQLPLPLPFPPLAAEATATPLPLRQVWHSLSPTLQLQCRRRLVTLLREVLHDAPEQ